MEGRKIEIEAKKVRVCMGGNVWEVNGNVKGVGDGVEKGSKGHAAA